MSAAAASSGGVSEAGSHCLDPSYFCEKETVHWVLMDQQLDTLKKLESGYISSDLFKLKCGLFCSLRMYPEGHNEDSRGHWSVLLDSEYEMNQRLFKVTEISLVIQLELEVPDLHLVESSPKYTKTMSGIRVTSWGKSKFIRRPKSDFSGVVVRCQVAVIDVVPHPTSLIAKSPGLETKSSESEEGEMMGAFEGWFARFDFAEGYQSLFIRHGFDSMDAVRLLTDDLLKEIGVTKLGHRVVFLDAVEKLKV